MDNGWLTIARTSAHRDSVVMIARAETGRRQARAPTAPVLTGTQTDSSMDVDMSYLCGTARRIDVQQDTDAFAQAIGYGNLASTHKRHFRPAHQTSCFCRKHSIQVFCKRENRTGDILRMQIILLDHTL